MSLCHITSFDRLQKQELKDCIAFKRDCFVYYLHVNARLRGITKMMSAFDCMAAFDSSDHREEVNSCKRGEVEFPWLGIALLLLLM